jgi:hypothetical protein
VVIGCASNSQPNPLDLVLSESFPGTVVKLGRARTFVRRHFLGMLERAAIGEIGGDPGRAEGVIADRRRDAGRGRAPADHEPGVRLKSQLVGEGEGRLTPSYTRAIALPSMLAAKPFYRIIRST